ncbi:MAG: histidine--tRNA ligase [Candidatus Eisenbacteria bacterium]|nr:histidine--tRNA ligase [Candidatus Eisenbacteria bacterium]
MEKEEERRKFQSIRGTRDILPPESAKWLWLEEKFRGVLSRFGYSEIRTPIFEHTELFHKGTGDSTDIVLKEMYTFVDRGGRSLTLRPEGTPSVARAVIEHGLLQRSKVLKLYYFGPMFRYGRPQAGRLRQFDQVGAELVGDVSVEGDAESILLHVMLLRELGLQAFTVKVNSVGCTKCRPYYSRLIQERLKDSLDGLCDDCKVRFDRNPLRILDCKVDDCKKTVEKVPSILECLCEECSHHFNALKERLAAVGLDFQVDPGLVRGLDYYTKTAFEIHHHMLGAQSALGGGGRYDGLIELYGGSPTPAVGFAAGLDRIMLAVEKENLDVPVPAGTDVYVVSVSEKTREKCFAVAATLRGTLRVELDLAQRSLQSQMKTANSLGARFSVIIGEDELCSGVFTVKSMMSGEQTKVAEAELEGYLGKGLEQ